MEDRRILDQHPLPLARSFRRFRNAPEPRSLHDAAYYLFEVYIKYAASVAMALYLCGEERDHRVNAALKGLVRPSLGEWMRFLRETLRLLAGRKEANPLAHSLAGLLEAKGSRWPAQLRLFNALREFRTGEESAKEKTGPGLLLDEVVAYRNRLLGHGAPVEGDHYRRFAALLGEAFPEIVEESAFLVARRLVVFEAPRVREGSRVECGVVDFTGLQPVRRGAPLVLPYGAPAPREDQLHLLGDDGSFLSLHPFLIAHGEDVYFLNEASGSLEYLSYSTGERFRPPLVESAQADLFERILGYRPDRAGITRLGDDLELDTFPARVSGDPQNPHLAVTGHAEGYQDVESRHLSVAEIPGGFPRDVWHPVRVDLRDGVISVSLGGERLISDFRIPDFKPSVGYIGFTAATGGGYQRHLVRPIRFQFPPFEDAPDSRTGR